jgi:nucleoside-diphosphate-sugar epimerase
MSGLVVIGTGRLGKAIHEGLGVPLRPQLFSGRDVAAKLHRLDGVLGEATCVIHAAGPAGEAACVEDPAGAFTLHYGLTEQLAKWALHEPGRHIILLGTVAPNQGFYGPLKRAAINRAEDLLSQDISSMGERLTVVECGHVIGEGLPISDRNAGVVARFVKGALQGRQLVLAGGGVQTLRYTALPQLVTLLHNVVTVPQETSTLSPVSRPVAIQDVARTCLRLAELLYGVRSATMIHGHQSPQPNYEDPTGEPVVQPEMHDVLVGWMRTVEAKMLLGVR